MQWLINRERTKIFVWVIYITWCVSFRYILLCQYIICITWCIWTIITLRIPNYKIWDCASCDVHCQSFHKVWFISQKYMNEEWNHKWCEYTSRDAYVPYSQYLWPYCVLYMIFYETIENVYVHHVMYIASMLSMSCLIP